MFRPLIVVANSPNASGSWYGDLIAYSLSVSTGLQNGAPLTLADGTSLPVVGQALGHSLQVRIALGPQVALVERLIAFLNAGLHPVIPQKGSVGASGGRSTGCCCTALPRRP